MSGPPPENYGDYSQGPSPPPPQHRQSAPPAMVFSGAFFSGAHHFDISGGEYSTAQNVNKTIHSDNSYRSNFNNRRTEDHRGTAQTTNHFRGEFNDNRQFRSQKYDATYNDIGQFGPGRGRGRRKYSPYIEDDYDDEEDYRPRRARGYGYGPGYRQRQRWNDDYADDDGNDNGPPRMIESREAVRQREHADFDSTYFAPDSRQNSRSEREREMEYTQAFQQEPLSYANQAEPEPQYATGSDSGNNNRNNSYASPPLATPTSRFNPFRAATAPVLRPDSTTGRADNFGPTRPTPSRLASQRMPPPSVEEVEDAEHDMDMQGVERSDGGEFERDNLEGYTSGRGHQGARYVPRPDPPRSTTTSPGSVNEK